jgi:hypothetical protein
MNWLFVFPVAVIFACFGLVSRGMTYGYLHDPDRTAVTALIGLVLLLGHLVFLLALPVVLFTFRRWPMLTWIVGSAWAGYGAGGAILRLA